MRSFVLFPLLLCWPAIFLLAAADPHEVTNGRGFHIVLPEDWARASQKPAKGSSEELVFRKKTLDGKKIRATFSVRELAVEEKFSSSMEFAELSRAFLETTTAGFKIVQEPVVLTSPGKSAAYFEYKAQLPKPGSGELAEFQVKEAFFQEEKLKYRLKMIFSAGDGKALQPEFIWIVGHVRLDARKAGNTLFISK